MMYSYVLSFKLIGINTEIPDGAKRTRTADPLHAMQVLYQLSYGPNKYILTLTKYLALKDICLHY